MKVKICGITDLETALTAIQNGADTLGFVFAESKRIIEPKMAREIISQLPREVLKVGVFVNETLENIEKIIIETGINMIQLHGDETSDFCRRFSLPTIKALSILNEADLTKITEYDTEFILLDSPRGKYRGGNGLTFDWSILKGHRLKNKIILAGGLNADNVTEAIDLVNPYMVDVSSGVETDGKKDKEKIINFLKQAKGKIGEEVR